MSWIFTAVDAYHVNMIHLTIVFDYLCALKQSSTFTCCVLG